MGAKSARRHHFLKNRDVPLTFGFAAVADFSSYIGQEYLAGIMQATQDYGIHFINMADAVKHGAIEHSLLSDSYFLSQFKEKTRFMRTPLLDGLVTWASSFSDYLNAEEIQALFRSLSPLPMVDIGYLDIQGVPNIRIDNKQSMHLILHHLTQVHDFSHIAFIGTRVSKPHATRLEYFKEEMNLLGLPCDAIFLAESLEAGDIAIQVDNLLAYSLQNGRIQAIVTSSDIIAGHTIEALEKRGISVPDGIAVTGFNNQLVGIMSAVPITTIDLAYFARGYEAVELLIDRIMQPTAVVENRLVKTSLVVRQSCSCFEKAVFDAMHDEPIDFSARGTQNASLMADTMQENPRSYLTAVAQHLFPDASEEICQHFADAVINDLYAASPQENHILVFFRERFKRQRNVQKQNQTQQEQISTFRRAVLPLATRSERSTRSR